MNCGTVEWCLPYIMQKPLFPQYLVPLTLQIVDLCLNYLSYDPNYNYDDDDDEMEGMEVDDDEDDDLDDDYR